MHITKRWVLMSAVSAVLLASPLVAGGTAASAAAGGRPQTSSGHISPQVSTCSRTDGHYYGAAWSGYGSSGTEAHIWTWTHWAVTSGSGHFSNEAVWLEDPSENASGDYNDDLEVGFFSGWLANNLGSGAIWTNGMLPYYSLYDGSDTYVQVGAYLPTNTWVWMYAQISGSNDYAYVNGDMFKEITNYPMSGDKANLQNYVQGEVTNSGTWMGGGVGDAMTMYSLNSSGDAIPWGFLSDCDDSPYWAKSSNGTDYFENGGY